MKKQIMSANICIFVGEHMDCKFDKMLFYLVASELLTVDIEGDMGLDVRHSVRMSSFT